MGRQSVLPLYIFLSLVLYIIILKLPSPPVKSLIRFGYFSKSTTSSSSHSSGWSSNPQILRPGSITADTSTNDEVEKIKPHPEYSADIGSIRNVRDDRFYQGGLLSLTVDEPSAPSAAVYDPYPDYESNEWRGRWAGRFRACEGPDGIDLDRSSPLDMITVYPGLQKDFPHPKLGSFDAIGLDDQVCADRDSRYGTYGHNGLHRSKTPIDWDDVNWGRLQAQCLFRNAVRYQSGRHYSDQVIPLPQQFTPRKDEREDASSSYKPRTAVIIRVWHDMLWTDHFKHHVRSVIMELALHSGAEYEVLILVQVRDGAPLYSTRGEVDAPAVKSLKDMFIPVEFHDMVVFFNNETLENWYPEVEESSLRNQTYQPIQLLAKTHPNFEFYWHLDTDVRFTGHTYHFLEKATGFAQKQPRKWLWERNAYSYVQDVHGSWNRFTKIVDNLIAKKGLPTVWGAVSKAAVSPVGPKPSVSRPSDDDYKWGVGEEADFISFSPIFKPARSDSNSTGDMRKLSAKGFDEGSLKEIDQRASAVTMSRLSKSLLNEMHLAQMEGWALSSEIAPSTVALWHGLKAVHVPHPIYVNGDFTPKELVASINPFSPARNGIWKWSYLLDHVPFSVAFRLAAPTADSLFQRWMGAHKVDHDLSTKGNIYRYHEEGGRVRSDGLDETKHGHLCYPSFLTSTGET